MFLDSVYFDNSIRLYVVAGLVFIGIWFFAWILRFFIVTKVKKWAERTESQYDDAVVLAVQQLHWPLYAILGLYAGLHILAMPVIVMTLTFNIVLVASVYYVLRAFQAVFTAVIEYLSVGKGKKKKRLDSTAISFISVAVKSVLWGIALLVILQNFGIDVTALIAGFGIGGIAIALAVQNLLGDLFASLSIYFDRPFEEGDFIKVGEDAGTVKKLGWRSTRIKTFTGPELILANSELASQRIVNYRKMENRIVVFSFGVLYETAAKDLERIPDLVKNIINKGEKTECLRVHLKELEDSSLKYEVAFKLKSKEYAAYMDAQHLINIELKRVLDREKIGFAYPTQTIHLSK